MNQVGGSYVEYLSAPSVRRLIQNEPPIKQSQQRSLQYSMPPLCHPSITCLYSTFNVTSIVHVTTKFSRVKLPVNSKSAPSSWSEPMRSIVIIFLRSLPLSANGASCPQEGCKPSFYTTWCPSFIWERLFPRKYLKKIRQ